ncbi:MAG: hypothetical protein R3D70_09295 [Rhizobiaceae bacterium]
MTPEQQRTLAIARARRRRAEAEGTGGRQSHPELDTSGIPGYDPATGMVESAGKPRVPSAFDPAGAFALSGPEGVPIVGPALNAAVRGGAAALVTPFSDQTFMDNYEDMGRIQKDVQEKNPISTVAGNVTGAVAGTLPMIAAAPSAFGLTQASMIGKSLASAGSGAAVGGADRAVRSGGDPREALKGAGWGAGLGALSPAAAALFGKGAGAVYDKVKNSQVAKQLKLDPAAWALFSKAAKRDEIDPGAAVAALDDLGEAGMIMDLGPNLQFQAGALAAMPGRPQNIVKEAIGIRDKAANMRIRGDVDQTIGKAPVPSKVIADIEANQAALSPEYVAVLKNGRPTNTAPIAKYLDREIQNLRGDAQAAMRKVRGMLDKAGGEGLETNPAVLLEARKAVDGMLETTVETNATNALTVARQALDDELRASVPGIKTVDAKYAELARQKEAIKRGQQTLSSGREAPRPSELADEVQSGALPQGEMVGPSAVPLRLSQGARDEIERLVGTTANNRVKLRDLVKGQGSWNRDRLATLFGDRKADQIIRIVEREKQFADTSHITTGNSLTAARQQAIKDVGGEEADAGLSMIDSYKAGGVPATVRAAGIDSAKKVLQALKDGGNEKAMEGLAQTLTSKDKAIIQALGLMQPMPMSQINRAARALMLTAGGVGGS